jgi:hypothetical protein
MGRMGDRAALGVFTLLSGGTFLGLLLTSSVRQEQKRRSEEKDGKSRAPKIDGSNFESKLQSLTRK